MTKTPTASAISRLLAAAGFERSERISGIRNWGRGNGGYSSGYVAEKDQTTGAVRVRHRIATDELRDPSLSNDAHASELAESLAYYAEAITEAGYDVLKPSPRFLIVTAKED